MCTRLRLVCVSRRWYVSLGIGCVDLGPVSPSQPTRVTGQVGQVGGR